jgi:hypothetical protein
MLARLVSIIATGGDAPLNPEPKSDEEWRKTITAALRKGHGLIVFDDVEGPVRAPSLATALTAGMWRDRILGRSETIELPISSLFAMTGCNLSFALAGDLPRRVVHIRLDPQSACPWVNRRFRHPRLARWALVNRGPLLAALLTLVRSWFNAGRPPGRAPEIASFEPWCRVIGGILEHAGIGGFLGNCQRLWTDPETKSWAGFLRALHKRFGNRRFTTAEVADRISFDAELRAATPEELGDDPDRQRLGMMLRRRIDRPFPTGGMEYTLQVAGASRGIQHWRICAKREDDA